MNIAIIENKELKRAVSARELHQFIGSREQFTDWCKRMISYLKLQAGEDFLNIMVFHKNMKNPDTSGGRPFKEYLFTIKAAKKIAMLQRTEKGEEAREYFIECEEKDVDYVNGILFNAKEVFLNFGKNPNSCGGRPHQDYFLTIDAAKEISMLQRTEKGKEARRYFIECERKLKDNTSISAIPNFSNPYEAALAWAEAYKEKEIAQTERDEAIKTKAWIGNKREATAMATASTEKRRADKLEDELGKGKNFKAVAM